MDNEIISKIGSTGFRVFDEYMKIADTLNTKEDVSCIISEWYLQLQSILLFGIILFLCVSIILTGSYYIYHKKKGSKYPWKIAFKKNWFRWMFIFILLIIKVVTYIIVE